MKRLHLIGCGLALLALSPVHAQLVNVSPSGGVSSKITSFTSSGAYTPSAGMKFARIMLYGAGGGGGSGAAYVIEFF